MSLTEDALKTAARTALACLDLTSLNDADTSADIEALCRRARGPNASQRRAVAAVCVWPRFAAQARALLPEHIAVAAVANFPDGSADIARAVADTRAIVAAGAQEVDVVMPYQQPGAAPALLQAVREACKGLKLKVILETGLLRNDDAVRHACRMALNAGADFLKTSTGKVPVNATLESAALLLQAIADDPLARHRVGFKPAGGVRTVADAAAYMALQARILGPDTVKPSRFRIGASGLLIDIEAVLHDTKAAAPGAGY